MQARSVAEGILATVALMQESRLPCFGRGAPLPNLRKRFHLDMTEARAAAFMRSTILDAYDKVQLCMLQTTHHDSHVNVLQVLHILSRCPRPEPQPSYIALSLADMARGLG